MRQAMFFVGKWSQIWLKNKTRGHCDYSLKVFVSRPSIEIVCVVCGTWTRCRFWIFNLVFLGGWLWFLFLTSGSRVVRHPIIHLHYYCCYSSTWPQSAMRTVWVGLPDPPLPTCSILSNTAMPSTTLPKTTCFPSNHSVLAVHKKNWLPLVAGPAVYS